MRYYDALIHEHHENSYFIGMKQFKFLHFVEGKSISTFDISSEQTSNENRFDAYLQY